MGRLVSFDIAKAIALICVIVGHTSFAGVPQSLVDFCYSFDMPLFFIVSGYFCKVQPLDGAYVKKNARGLLLPYVITSIIVIVLMAVRAAILSEGIRSTAISWVVAALYGAGGVHAGMPAGVIGIGAIWYLLALFWAKLLLAAAHQTKWPWLVSLCLFIVGVSTKDAVWLPWSIQPALCAVLFMWIGQQVKANGLLQKGALPGLLWVCMVMTWLYCGAFYGQLYMESNMYAHGAIDVIGGVAGSLCVLKFSELVLSKVGPLTSFLSWFGRNTLPLFCMHLVELNVVRWDLLIAWVNSAGLPIPTWVVILAIQFAAIAALTFVLYTCPRMVSGVFFPKRKEVAWHGSN